jgi:hypothetical protein
MAIPAPRKLNVGKIVDKTLGVLEVNAVPALIYVLVLTAASVPITYASVGSTEVLPLLGGQLLRSAIGIVCGYFLLVAMIRRTGLQSRTEDVFIAYLGLMILYSLGVMLGFIAIILPGIFLLLRWSIAQPTLVARGTGIKAALGESWDRTNGHEITIFLAALAMLLLPIAVMIAVGAFFEQGNLVRMIVSELATSAISLIFLSMGVALYGLIVGQESVAGTFG